MEGISVESNRSLTLAALFALIVCTASAQRIGNRRGRQMGSLIFKGRGPTLP
jgi:hypothetical protein